MFDDLVEFLAALLVELRDGDADDFAVHNRIDAEFGFLNRFVNRHDKARVPRLDDDEARFRRRDAGQFAQAHVRAIHFHHDILDQRRRSFACAHAGKLVLHHLFRLDHLVLRLQQNIVNWHSN